MDKKVPLTVGLTAERNHTVEMKDTALACAGDAFQPVYSTPTLIGMLEDTSHDAIAACLEPGQSTVGTMVSMKHLAATPVGMKVRLRAELTEVNKRRLMFKIEAWDELDKITEGTHERYIIDNDKFAANFKAKCAKVNCGSN
ncbi:MAG TPA: thioesterase family protein [Bellilinea sp.]|nr:thioesterase family protein [Bellilinea sp.]